MSVRNVFGFILVVAIINLLSIDTAFAQRGGRDGGGMMRIMGTNNQFGLLSDTKVREELELVDDQIKELDGIQEEAMQVMRDMFSEMQDMPRDQMREGWRGMREKMEEKMKPFEGRVKEVLLPHQHTRLKQLTFQNSSRGQGAGSALQNDDLLEELEVTDEQREKLDEAIKEAHEDLQKKYAKLIKEAEDDVLKVLDSGQRKKYREMVGDPFQFENRNARRTRGGDRENNRRRGDR